MRIRPLVLIAWLVVLLCGRGALWASSAQKTAAQVIPAWYATGPTAPATPVQLARAEAGGRLGPRIGRFTFERTLHPLNRANGVGEDSE